MRMWRRFGIVCVIAVWMMSGSAFVLRATERLAPDTHSCVLGWGDASEVFLNGTCNLVAITVGPAHGLGITMDGRAIGWGSNSYWQIEIPNGINGVVDVAVGELHSLALQSNGTVVA
jgi:alpha-tubulin suppressor-like RCC1 family protein